MARNKVAQALARHSDLLSIKHPWNVHYQALAEVFYTRKRDFTSTISPGEFLQEDVYSNVGQFAAFMQASVFTSMLWPDASRTFTLDPVDRIKDIPGVEEWFKNIVTPDMQKTADTPRAGLGLAFMEHFADQAVFGTSGIGVFENPDVEDEEVPTLFEAWDIKAMTISENSQGFVDTIYWLEAKTVRQVVEEYGTSTSKVSPKVLEMYKEKKYDEKIDVLKVIEPKKADLTKRGLASMKVRTMHIDKTHSFMMKESGFTDMPVFVARMFKTKNDGAYGRSSGMLALADMISLNTLSEDILVATGKKLDPPLALLDNGRLGNGVIDTSQGALNVFNTSGMLDSKSPIIPLFTVDDLNNAKEHKEELKQAVMQAFFLDRLLDLNNQTQMTAFETSVRDRLRGESSGSMFGRQEMEVITPTIKRHFRISYDRGRFGVVPGKPGSRNSKWDAILGGTRKGAIVPDVVAKAIEQGLQVFDINYISPAKRFQQGEKLQGLLTASDIIMALDAVFPGMKDNVDPDKMAEAVFKLTGAPRSMKRTAASRDQVREQQVAIAKAEGNMEAAQGASDVALKVEQARAMMGTGKK